ncbi:hypothetical protein D3C85_1711600 [compost metagenome]
MRGEAGADKAPAERGARRGKSESAAGIVGNTDVQKSRDLKKALLSGAKAGSKPAAGRGGDGAAKKPASSHRKGAPKADAPSTAGKPRKRKAKS